MTRWSFRPLVLFASICIFCVFLFLYFSALYFCCFTLFYFFCTNSWGAQKTLKMVKLGVFGGPKYPPKLKKSIILIAYKFIWTKCFPKPFFFLFYDNFKAIQDFLKFFGIFVIFLGQKIATRGRFCPKIAENATLWRRDIS